MLDCKFFKTLVAVSLTTTSASPFILFSQLYCRTRRTQTVSRRRSQLPDISHKRHQNLIPSQTLSIFHNIYISSIIVWRIFILTNTRILQIQNTDKMLIKIHFPRWFFPIDFLISWNKLTKALHLSDALASLPYRQLIIKNCGHDLFLSFANVL